MIWKWIHFGIHTQFIFDNLRCADAKQKNSTLNGENANCRRFEIWSDCPFFSSGDVDFYLNSQNLSMTFYTKFVHHHITNKENVHFSTISKWIININNNLPAPIFLQSLRWSHQMILDGWIPFCFGPFDEMFLPVSDQTPKRKTKTRISSKIK